MNVFIAGGFGYVGGVLAKALTIAGHNVTVGTTQEFLSMPDSAVSVIGGIDYEDTAYLSAHIGSMDVIINSAGPNSTICKNFPETSISNRVKIAANLYEAINHGNRCKYIYISSAHVYSDNLVGAITEESKTLGSTPYAKSHIAAEKKLSEISSSRGGDITILRLSNVYGQPAYSSPECWNLLVNDICKQAIETGEIVLKSDGTLVRNFIHTKDVAKVLEFIISHDVKDNSNFRIINIGSNIAYTVKNVANIVAEACGIGEVVSPNVINKVNSSRDEYINLDYQSQYIFSHNVIDKRDIRESIIELLEFCKENFSCKN